MILGYRNRQTADFADGERVPAFESFRRQAEMRLDRLEAAPNLLALRGFPGNRLEALRGKRKGQYSIRINDQWRFASTGRKANPARANWKLRIIMIERN